MSLDALVEEIRRRGEAELQSIDQGRAEEEQKILADRDQRLAGIAAESKKAAESDAARERTQKVAGAKLKARKALYEARESRLGKAVEETRALLADYTSSPAYPATLRKMVETATDALGKSIRVRGRAEDAAPLQKAAGKSFDPTPLPILGGLVAESADGHRRLNLSFDELLRLHEDRVRALLA